MKRTNLLPVFIAVGLGFILLGFYSQKSQSPEDLGLYRAQLDDRGLLELAVDRLRHGLKSGNAEMLQGLIAESYTDVPNGVKSDASLMAVSRTNILSALKTHTSSRFDLNAIEFQIPSRDDEQAIVRSEISDGQAGLEDVEFTFEKIRGQWKLIRSRGFAEAINKLSGTENRERESDPAFEVYREAGPKESRTLLRRALSPDHGVEKLTQSVTLDKLDRKLFSKPYAGVLFSSVTQLNRAPYFDARYVQLVTDPAWNRIVYGDYDGWIKAYGNSGGPEALNRPHGLDRDADGRIYVADTGNNRIVVLKLHGSGEQTELQFEFAFGKEHLNRPYDVAWDDRGTPFQSADDIIWVADSGNHRIVGYALVGNDATVRYIFGETGSGPGAFFEPQGLAVGRFNGLSEGTLYVADTGNRRLAKLSVLDNRLEWQRAFQGRPESQFTSVAVDHWGNVYLSDRSYTEVRKLTSELEPLAAVRGKENQVVDPVNFHVIYGRVEIPAENRVTWAGYDQAFLLEKWSPTSGAERYQLGVDLEQFRVQLAHSLDEVRVQAKLTDHSNLQLTVIDAASNRTIRQIPLGWRIPGEQQIVWDRRDDIGWQVEPGRVRLQLTAQSSYGESEVLKETPEFYLPLYYREDSGADVHHDAHLVQGARNRDLGAAPHETIATHPSEVVYRFTDLNPTVDYEIKAEFFNEVGSYLQQRIAVDETVLVDAFEVQPDRQTLDWVTLPGELYRDGEILVQIQKTAGDADAMISQLWLREANYDPAHPPLQQDTESQIPESYTLSQNYPNPFNPTTTIEFGVPEGMHDRVTLKIYNVLGQAVAELVNQNLPPGRHVVMWNGRDGFGNQVSSGVYFYQLKAGEFVANKKLILMK